MEEFVRMNWHWILIYQKNITPSANKVILEMQPKYVIETFQESELLVNITQHGAFLLQGFYLEYQWYNLPDLLIHKEP